MAWDEWEQVKQEAAQRHGTRMQLNQLPPGDGPGPSTSNVTGGLKTSRRAWNKAGEDVGGLRRGIGEALTKLQSGQRGLGDASGCLSADAQKEVFDSWSRYLKDVKERCGSVKEVLEQVGHEPLRDRWRLYALTPAAGWGWC
ncbi:MAG: hypothetical protein H5T76_18065 [Streptomyces sp.]|nr:hypothetical protein [Streptomyces sp.]